MSVDEKLDQILGALALQGQKLKSLEDKVFGTDGDNNSATVDAQNQRESQVDNPDQNGARLGQLPDSARSGAAYARLGVHERVAGPTSAEGYSTATHTNYSDIQEEFLVIRDSLQSIRLPHDQKLHENRSGIARASQPGYNVISRCGKYVETALKWLGTQEPTGSTQQDLVTLHTILLSNLRYLQGEYQALLVGSQFDTATAQVYRSFQGGNSGFDDTARANLRAAVELSSLRGRVNDQGQGPRRGGFSFSNRGRGYRGGRNYNNVGNRDIYGSYAQRSVNPNRGYNYQAHQDDPST